MKDLEAGAGMEKLSQRRMRLDADDVTGGEPQASLQEQSALTEVRTDIEHGTDGAAGVVVEGLGNISEGAFREVCVIRDA